MDDIQRHRDDIEEYLAQITRDIDLRSHVSQSEIAPEYGASPGPASEVLWDSISERVEKIKESNTRDFSLPDSPIFYFAEIKFTLTDFYAEILEAGEKKPSSQRISVSDTGERLLAAGASWDFIIKHPLYQRVLLDVGDVSERLKHVAKRDGDGPVFRESSTIEAIERSAARWDDLL